jgi:hypothetical protein
MVIYAVRADAPLIECYEPPCPLYGLWMTYVVFPQIKARLPKPWRVVAVV